MFSYIRNLGQRSKVKGALGDYALPSFPAASLRVLECLRDDRSSAAQIGDAIAGNPGLSVRMLSLANSAAYSPSRRVSDLRQAVAMLGLPNVETLVLGQAVSTSVGQLQVPGFDMARFWRTAARRACVAQALASRLHAATASLSFTAALLQDMAVPLLAHACGPRYVAALDEIESETPLWQREREQVGVDHVTAGAWLCERWGLPEALSEAIGGHHEDPDHNEGCPDAVALSSVLPPPDATEEISELRDEVCARYQWSPAAVDQLVTGADERGSALAAFFC